MTFLLLGLQFGQLQQVHARFRCDFNSSRIGSIFDLVEVVRGSGAWITHCACLLVCRQRFKHATSLRLALFNSTLLYYCWGHASENLPFVSCWLISRILWATLCLFTSSSASLCCPDINHSFGIAINLQISYLIRLFPIFLRRNGSISGLKLQYSNHLRQALS